MTFMVVGYPLAYQMARAIIELHSRLFWTLAMPLPSGAYLYYWHGSRVAYNGILQQLKNTGSGTSEWKIPDNGSVQSLNIVESECDITLWLCFQCLSWVRSSDTELLGWCHHRISLVLLTGSDIHERLITQITLCKMCLLLSPLVLL